MAGLLDIFGTGGGEALGLLGGDVSQSRNDAQAQALYALAGSLLSGGPTGQSIVRGLQQGSQAYRGSMKNDLEDRMGVYQLQELKRKQAEEQAAKARQQRIDQAVAGAYQPAQAAVPGQMVEEDGRYMGETPGTEGRAASLNLQGITPALMTSSEGRKTLAELSKLIPDMRKAGLGMDQRTEDNPFAVFTSDPTIPKHIKTLASQYANSWSGGRLDPDVADKRVSELSSMAQRAQDKDVAQQNLQAQQAQMVELRRQGLAQSAEARALQAEIARNNLAIQKENAVAKTEERQKPVTEARESLNLIDQAGKLLDTATGSLVGAGVDVLAGSLGVSTAGAKDAAKLKAIQGALVAKMPKMSGPQSDKDVLLYREMAAQVGDPTIPVDTRKAALGTLREIQERYAKVEPGSSAQQPAMQPKTPFRFDSAKEDRYQQWLKTQGR